MAISLNIESFASRVERAAIGNDGVRTFINTAEGLSKQEGGGFFSSIIRFGVSLLTKVFEILFSGFAISWNAVWSLIVSATGYIYNFNWNISEEEIAGELVTASKGVAYQFSFATGSAFGYLACGALPGLLISTFNEALAVEIYEKVGETALNNLAGQLAAILQQTGQALGQAAVAFVLTHPNVFINPVGELSKLAAAIEKVVDKKHASESEKQKKKPWSFAIAVNHKADTIPNEVLRECAKQFMSGASQSCVEAGYIVASTIDAYYTSQKQSNHFILGAEAVVEIDLVPSVTSPSS